ncbi:hypothetical protein ACI5KX_13315 [Erythrobacter sp. GH1-10]|uniref:hypothetical protein n=1 Tax=Erythrobacter sp. GH1-10 TaxID=3349334 RepID=UPI00387805A4
MSSLAALGAGALTLASPLAAQDAAGSQPAPMKCERGPVERYFDNVQWYVFACEDEASLVFFTGPKSPADLQFYFLVYPKDGTYKVYGEGKGDKALTKPAYDAISSMTASDFRALHSEASAQGR